MVEVLVSTVKQNDYKLLEIMKLQSDCVVVNQCGRDSVANFHMRNGYSVNWINSSAIGLSRSRNLAIRNSSAEICVLADDDLVYVENYSALISREFKKRKKADVIAFIVEGINREFKKYPKDAKRLNLISSMRISSVQIAFRRASFVDKNISFKEEFGAGSTFYAGEENIMLADCLRMGLSIHFVPVKIADIYLGDSTWFEGFTERYFITKGAGFTAMSKLLSIPLIVQFALRKVKLYKKEMSLKNAIKSMLKGRDIYLSGDYSKITNL